MFVKAAPGLRCPKEHAPREYVGAAAEEVPDTAYYRRLVRDGSLLVSRPAAQPPSLKRERSES